MGLKDVGVTQCYNGGLLNGTRYVSLHTADPAAGNELSGNGYQRMGVTFAGWTISAPTGTATNKAKITFPAPTGTWGDPTHIGLWTGRTAGNLLASLALSANVRPPATGDTVEFQPGALVLDFTVDGE